MTCQICETLGQQDTSLFHSRYCAKHRTEIYTACKAGEPVNEIAARYGLTKGKVVGLFKRIKDPDDRHPRATQWDNRKKEPPPAPRLDDTEDPHEPRGCVYIHGHPDQGDWRYCQAGQQAGSSYCAYHHHICYTPYVPKVKPKRPVWRVDRAHRQGI